MTHDELIYLAVKWLRRVRNCHVVLFEKGTSGEIPDAIGFKWGPETTLIECKVSRNDFYADRGKPHRKNPETGIGLFRFYLTPKGLLKPEELPKGWGLLEVRGKTKRIYRIKKAFRQERNIEREYKLLLSAAAFHPMYMEGGVESWLKAWKEQKESDSWYGRHIVYNTLKKLREGSVNKANAERIQKANERMKKLGMKKLKKYLKMITNKTIKKAVMKCLENAPARFWTAPASTSGNWHPLKATKRGGLIWHTARACKIFVQLRPTEAFELSAQEFEQGLAAIILHDIRKENIKTHCQDAVKFIRKHIKKSNTMERVVDCVSRHMGPWSDGEGKGVFVETGYSHLEYCVYMADYLASRKWIKLVKERP